jgi:hypothetical protein
VVCLAFGDDLRDGQVLFAKKDLVFGIVAFDPVTGCSGKCKPEAYRVGVRQWVNSVRRSTQRDRTEVALFTGKGPGNLVRDTVLARVLRRSSVRVLEGDFDDSNERVAHREPSRHVHCVMRNRWFVIRDHLRSHAHRYRFVLMTDVRDVLLQGDPFQWRPDELQRAGSERFDLTRTVVLSGEGSGATSTSSCCVETICGGCSVFRRPGSTVRCSTCFATSSPAGTTLFHHHAQLFKFTTCRLVFLGQAASLFC